MHLTTNTPGATFRLMDDPLSTQVILDERAQREFALKVALLALEDLLLEVHVQLEHGEVDRAKATVGQYLEFETKGQPADGSYSYWEAFAEKNSLSSFKDALSDTHGGDCTCVPCSCIKCHAEDIAEVDTLPGLGKHATRLLASALAGRFPNPDSPQQIAAVSFAEKHRYSKLEQDNETQPKKSLYDLS